MTREIEQNEFAQNWDAEPGPITQAVHEAFEEADHMPAAPAVNASNTYPVDTPEHAAASKARAAQELEAGHLSAEEKKAIDAKADAVLASK